VQQRPHRKRHRHPRRPPSPNQHLPPLNQLRLHLLNRSPAPSVRPAVPRFPKARLFAPSAELPSSAPEEAFAEPLSAAPTVSSARLVVVANNTELPLAAGSETVIGREDPYSGIYPDIDLTPHGGEEGGVSRRHFKINGIGNQYTIEDLNSTNLTIVNQTRLQPGVRLPLQDGDQIQAGRVKLIFRIN